MAKPNTNLADVEFILERVLWFLRLTPEELMAHVDANRMDAFHTILNPKNGGFIIIGQDATQRFWNIANRYLKADVGKKTRANLAKLVEKLRNEFSQRFLCEGRAIDQSNVDKMINAAYKAAERDFEVLTHYIPCAVFFSSTVKKFTVGPVTFLHESEFYATTRDGIEKFRSQINARQQTLITDAKKENIPEGNVIAQDLSAKQANRHIDGLLTSFKDYNWFGVIEVPACEREVSYERALFATRGALNTIKLILGAQYTYRLRTAEDYGHAAKAAKLRRKANGDLAISLSTTPVDNIGGDNWFDVLTNHAGSCFKLAEQVLTVCTTFDKPPHLSARFSDSLYWFGDAIAERSPGAKVVKYVSAIERICGTGEEIDDKGVRRGVTEIVTMRAAILYSIATDSPVAAAKCAVAKIYECRSNLVHGSISPFDESVSTQVVQAHEIARMVLLAGLDYFASLGLEDMAQTEKTLRLRYSELEKGLGETVRP